MINIYKKIKKINEYFIYDDDVNLFLKYNNKKFDKISKIETNEIILTELTSMQSSIIAISYYIRHFLKKKKYKVISFNPYKFKFRHKITFFLQKFFNSNLIKLYKSMRVENFMQISFSSNLKKKNIHKIKNIYNSLKSKKNLEDLMVDNTLLGDLIYDHFIVHEKIPTIDLKSKKFKFFFFEAMFTYYFWIDYLSNNNVKAINITHCCYLNGIICRIAIKRNIDVYLFASKSVFKISENNKFAWKSYQLEKNYFKHLSNQEKSLLLIKAKKQIDKRFSGEIGVDMAYSQKSAFNQSSNRAVLRKTNNRKVLICSHCFFDSVHAYGNNLFTDFYEWLETLGQLSNNTNYDWYIKTHPDINNYSLNIIEKFVKKYPKIILLNQNTSHLQIVNEGIDCVLTVYGSVGFEYAMLGVKVINASLNNPHIDYKFNFHPKSKKNYIEMINNLENLKININQDEILEYYAIRNLLDFSDWLFKNHSKMISDLGGYRGQFTNKVFRYWLEGANTVLDKEICDNIQNFIDTKNYKLTNLSI